MHHRDFFWELLISSPLEQQGRETDLPAVPRDDFTRRRITRDQSNDLSSPTRALASLFLIQLQKQICSGTGCCAQSVKHSHHQEGRWDYSLPQLHYILNLLKSWKERVANTHGREKSSSSISFSYTLQHLFRETRPCRSLSLKQVGKRREKGDAFN